MNVRLFQLVVRSGPTPGKIFPIMKTEVIIGRDPNADILVNDAEVSRNHAVIRFNAEGYVIEDLGSTNGTVVNGDRLAGPHVLKPGSIISLGEHISLLFEPQPVIDPDATVVSGPLVTPQKQAAPMPGIPPVGGRLVTPPTIPAYTPEPFYEELQETKPKKIPTWLILLLVGAVLVTCICLIAILAYVDNNFLWCDLLPFLPGCQL
jgi:hypothetical protein